MFRGRAHRATTGGTSPRRIVARGAANVLAPYAGVVSERFVNPADRNEDMGASQENACAGEPSGQVQGGVKGVALGLGHVSRALSPRP